MSGRGILHGKRGYFTGEEGYSTGEEGYSMKAEGYSRGDSIFGYSTETGHRSGSVPYFACVASGTMSVSAGLDTGIVVSFDTTDGNSDTGCVPYFAEAEGCWTCVSVAYPGT